MPSDIGQNPLVLYNWNLSIQLQGYLTAQTAVAAGVPGATAKIVAIGDSTTAGVGDMGFPFIDYRNGGSYPNDLAQDLTASGVPAQSDDFIGGLPGEDGRITLIGDTYWADVLAAGEDTPVTQSAGSGLGFELTAPGVYDQLDVTYLDIGTGAVTISVDGGLATTLQLGNTGRTLTQTIDLPLGLHSEVTILSTTSTPVYISGAAFQNTVTPSVQVFNLGNPGQDSTVVNLSARIGDGGTTQIGEIPGAIELAPNLVLINFGINDINNGTLTPAQTAANIAKMVADFQANGIDVILVIPQPFESPNYLTEIPVLRADLHAVADAMNVPIIDLSATYNDDFSSLAAAGLMSDALHPDAMLYADIAADYAKLLTSSASITVTGSTLVTQAGVVSTLFGSANAVTAVANSVLDAAGNGDFVMASAGDTVDIAGSNNVVASTGAITVNMAGSGGTVTAGAASQVTVQDGLNITVNASASTLFVQTGVSGTLSGSGNAATVEHDSLLSVIGDGNAVAASGGDTVYVGGAANTVSSADDVNVSLAGDSNTAKVGATSYVTIQAGHNATVHASGSTLIMQDSVSADLYGSGDTVTTGHGSLFNLAGDGNSIVAGDGALVNAAGNGNAVTSAGSLGVNLAGNGDTVTVGAPSTVGLLSGNGITVNASASTIVTLAGVGASLYGSGNTVTAGSGSSIALYGAGNRVFAGNSASPSPDVAPIDLVSVNGNANLVFLGSGQAQIDDGSSNLTLLLSGPSLAVANGIDIINGFGAARGAMVDLAGGAGGYVTAEAAFQAIVPDGQGGSLLALNATASLDFAGLPQSSLSAANFRVG